MLFRLCFILFVVKLVSSQSSPCPEIFSYEPRGTEPNKWYGVLSLKSSEDLKGVLIHVVLDRSAELLGNWFGEATSTNNKEFTIINSGYNLERDTPLSLRFFIKYNAASIVPKIQEIRLNGRVICSISSGSFDTSTPYVSRPSTSSPVGPSRPSQSNNRPSESRNPSRPSRPSERDPSEARPLDNRRPSNQYTTERRSSNQYTTERTHQPDRYTTERSNNWGSDSRNPSRNDNDYSSTRGSGSRNNNDRNRDQRHRPAVDHNIDNNRRQGSGYHDEDDERYTSSRPDRGNNRGSGNRGSNVAYDPNSLSTNGRPGYDSNRDRHHGDRRPNDRDRDREDDYTNSGSRRPSPPDDPYNGNSNDHGGRRRGGGNSNYNPSYYDNTRPSGDGRNNYDPYGPTARRPNGEDFNYDPYYDRTTRRPGGGVSNYDPYDERSTRRPYGESSTRPNIVFPSGTEKEEFFMGDFNSHDALNRPSVQPQLHTQNNDEQCGTVAASAAPLISYGQNTSVGQWPWHAALYHSKGSQLTYICGGTLISRSYVITAAHCVTKPRSNEAVKPLNILVYLGKHNLKMFIDVQDRPISQIFVHPDYNYSTYYNDVALLKLLKKADITANVRPCCLWQGNSDQQEIIGNLGTVVGWGFDENRRLSDELVKAEMPVVSTVDCIYSNRDFFSRFTSENSFCAGFRNGTTVCNGDSGGGMLFPRRKGYNTVWQLRGIVSVGVALQGEGVCDPNHYIVFTDVSKFLDWIKNIMDKN